MKQYYSFLLLFLLSEQLFTQTGQPCPGIPTIDYGGKTYHTVQINNQCWLKENLNIGTMINGSIGQSNNGIIEKYCYNNDSLNCEIYGGYYQLNEALHYVNLNGTQGICPTGWHIPTQSEFWELENAVGGSSNALKAIGQGDGEGAGTNTTGFSLLIAGQFDPYKGFKDINKKAYVWTSSEFETDYFMTMYVYALASFFMDIHFSTTYGNSVRCINDLTVSALPVELNSFMASVHDGSVVLFWRTTTEINSAMFVIEKQAENSKIWNAVGKLPAAGNSFASKEYTFDDHKVANGAYYYRLRMVDLDGSYQYSSIVRVVVQVPQAFSLYQNFPNPFNNSTTITYQIPETADVSLKVYSVHGELVRVLVNKTQSAGTYSVALQAGDLGTSEYFYQLQAGKYIETKKFTLLK